MKPGEIHYINEEFGEEYDIHESAMLQGLIDLRYKVTIEKDVFFGFDVMLLTGGHDPDKFGQERMGSGGGGPVTIHEGAWIASRAMIIGPSTIGKNSVLGAGSVVKGNIPPYELWIGNPARFVRKLKHD